MPKLTTVEVLERICTKNEFNHQLDKYKLAEFLVEYLPEKEIEEMPGFEGTREDLDKISIK